MTQNTQKFIRGIEHEISAPDHPSYTERAGADNERSENRGSMNPYELATVELESVAERGLSSFLQAFAHPAPDENLQKIGDCWIRAIETTDWSPGESADKFICHVTINALAIHAGRIKSKLLPAQLS